MTKWNNLKILIVGLTSVLALANFSKSHFKQVKMHYQVMDLNFSVVV